MIDRRQLLERIGWLAMVDYLLVQQAVLINQVAPKDQAAGLKITAEYVITAEWPMAYDADVDLHVIVPDNAAKDGSKSSDVWYNARETNGVSLDHDCKGWTDSHHIVYKDGERTVLLDLTQKEMTTIRGKLPGHFDVAIHMFKFHRGEIDVLGNDHTLNCPVRVELIKLNPKVSTVFSADLVMQHVKQCINVVSFDLDSQGNLTMTDLPLKPVTDKVFDSVGGLR
jgi:hypothetical protein